ncbi:MAG: PH domain-containing protein [Phycisphaerales bacterium]
MSVHDPETPSTPFDPTAIERPDPTLLTYYMLVAAMTVIGFPFVFLPLWLKYRTLQYRFDDRGVSMSWGMFFKREIYLTYRRIQDIHVSRNLFHRWLGLADVAVQTASGSSGAEMTIEGVRDPEKLRDFLYSQMRGGESVPAQQTSEEIAGSDVRSSSLHSDEGLELLREIRSHLAALREQRGADRP